tara:strand:+ start:7187 stop:7675 length:489 start_codon:yes stop_codon:yes gene_type:complete
MKPIDAAWIVLKEDFDLQQALDANMDPNNPMAQMLAQARAKPPAPPLKLEKLPRMPNAGGVPSTDAIASRQTTLPPELTAGANVSDTDFRDIKIPSSLFGKEDTESKKKAIIDCLKREGGAASVDDCAKACGVDKVECKKLIESMDNVKIHKHGDAILMDGL